MKRIVIVLLLIVSILFFSNKLFNSSFAYSYEINNSVLFYKEDNKELEEDMKIYLGYIDDYIIPNSSYLYGNNLVDNYDFLVHFALDYILNNKEYYSNEIEKMSSCSYFNRNGVEEFVFDYVTLSTIYDLTDFYFGVRDFTIINDDVCIVNDYVSITDYTDDKFKFQIKDISVLVSEFDINTIVSYNGGYKYLYTFYNDNNVLKIKNVEVI